ncbi:hypothetical protein E2986_11087 [Frieseomelitta varia]|uniref:Uncharacterized protein n=1 Tax=Frieseomelitta varia TaxID=561572 RepID=A0A833S8B0_9HYME|nr:hypothetical protein E2986_11087 [Frieseomelitta varia]
METTRVIVIPRKTMCVTATPLSAKKILKDSARHPARTSIATNVQVQGLTGGTNNAGDADRPQHTSIIPRGHVGLFRSRSQRIHLYYTCVRVKTSKSTPIRMTKLLAKNICDVVEKSFSPAIIPSLPLWKVRGATEL